MGSGIRISGLWQKETAQGVVFYEGNWGNATIRVYQNSYKKSDKDPDCIVYLSETPKEERRTAGPPKVSGPPFQKKSGITPRPTQSKTFVDHTAPKDSAPWPDGPNDHDSEVPF